MARCKSPVSQEIHKIHSQLGLPQMVVMKIAAGGSEAITVTKGRIKTMQLRKHRMACSMQGSKPRNLSLYICLFVYFK